jgi:LmbE family N-acetylglucosaminyl deacetylase
MLQLIPKLRGEKRLRLLCLGAHADDIEIGCGGTVLTWLATMPSIDITWVVLSADHSRSLEARSSARALLRHAAKRNVVVGNFRDGFLPSQYADVKCFFEDLKRAVNPDIVLTHQLHDRHQDHRLAAELSWNTWRNHLVLEYEIAKYEGDLVPPNTYVPLTAALARRKTAHLNRYFLSQRRKDWFLRDNFLGLMRLRGLECRSPSGLAEAFHSRKVVL